MFSVLTLNAYGRLLSVLFSSLLNRDRMMLLKLEQEILEFINDNK